MKYRQAVDSGPKSGHGRVVLLYFELCEQIWGGSPATSTIECGMESAEIGGDSFNDSQTNSSGNSSFISEAQLNCSGSATSDLPFSHGDASADETDERNMGERLSSSVVKERRELLKRTLSGYRQEKLKRKIPAEKATC